MSMPPVGQNLIPGNGAATALSQATPPDCSAGKNLSTVKPRSISAIASLTVAQPGTTGTGASASAAASVHGVERSARAQGDLDHRQAARREGARQGCRVGRAIDREHRNDRRLGDER